MNRKNFFRISHLLILSVLFFSSPLKAEDVNDFTQLQEALDNSAVSDITIISDDIIFNYNIPEISSRTVAIKSSAASGFTRLSGSSTFRGIKAAGNSEFSFENIIFDAFRSPNPASSSSGNLGGALSFGASKASFSGTVSFTNNNAYMGAGIYASDNSELLFSSQVSFSENQAVSGAALALKQSSVRFEDYAHITGNFSSSNGGAVYADNGSTITFTSGAGAYISDNISYRDGGGLYLNNSQAAFNSTAEIVSNESDYAGGGLYLSGSKAEFNGAADLNSNSAGTNGGGFYAASGSTVSFNAPATVSENKALYGAGFYANKSTVTFDGVSEILYNESRNMGGGFYTDNAEAVFNADTNISSNSSANSGGGFLAGNRSNIIFDGNTRISSNSSSSGGGFRADNSNIHFSNAAASAVFHNNRASQLGGAFASNYSMVTFDSSVSFTQNGASHNGGAIYATASKVFFNGESVFSDNSSEASGGAAAITNNSFLHFSGKTEFSENSSLKGGALYIESSSASLVNPQFYNNEAATAGGAIYLTGTAANRASVEITASTGEQAVFSGNKAGGVSNALYIGSYSSAAFHARSGASIEMHDGIAGSNTDASFIFSGEGDFNFYGNASGNMLNMIISASGGGAFNIRPGAVFEAGKLTNHAGSIFNMSNGAAETVHVAELNNSGTLAFDAFASGVSDKIYVSGNVTLSTSSANLEINSDISDTNFKKIIYTLIHYDGKRDGIFADMEFNSPVTFSTGPKINYGDILNNWITVTLYGEASKTDFASLPGLNFNQAQVANAFDNLSDKNSGKIDTIMGIIEGFDEAGKKKALLQSSGYFLANAIRNAAAENESAYVFNKINTSRNSASKDNNVWAQYIGNALTFAEDKNSPKDYQDTSNGIMIGFDTLIESRFSAGFYGKYLSHNIKQSSKNTAEINSTGLGFYSGYKDRFWEFKGLVCADFNENNTNRYIPFAGQKAKADFNSTTFGLDMEGATNLKATRFLYLRPYAGFELRNVSYKGFTEKNAGALNLNVDGGNYFRSALKLGASINHDNSLYSYFLGLETKYLMNGDINVIEASFDGTDASFKSKTSTEGRFALGLSAGAKTMIAKDITIFVTGDLFKAAKYENFHANIGVRYSFNNPETSTKHFTPDSKKSAPDNNEYAPPPPPVPYDEGIVLNEDIPIGEELYKATLP